MPARHGYIPTNVQERRRTHPGTHNARPTVMKNLLVAVLALATVPLFTACASPASSAGLPTIKFPEEKASGENMNNILRAWHWDSRALIDDINTALLIDRPSQLSRWHVR